MEPEKSRKPEDSPFKQQRLKAWQPILTPRWVIGTFALVGIVFVPIGVVLKNESDNVVEYSIQYDGDGTNPIYTDCMITNKDEGNLCTLTFNIEEDMDGPVYLYYQLENFYQNHRRYVKSRSDSQLRGDILGEGDLSDCDPLKERDGKILSPCGLIAQSFFNDVITVTSGETLDETGIAWKSDLDDKFDNPDDTDTDVYEYLWETFPDNIDETVGVKDEHFIVWMRTAGLPDFRKLYGKIDAGLSAGTVLTVAITNNFMVSSFDGRKSIVLSTTSWFGGKNPFLGIAYITVGSLCLFLAALFLMKHILNPRPLGDTRYLVWKNRA